MLQQQPPPVARRPRCRRARESPTRHAPDALARRAKPLTDAWPAQHQQRRSAYWSLRAHHEDVAMSAFEMCHCASTLSDDAATEAQHVPDWRNVKFSSLLSLACSSSSAARIVARTTSPVTYAPLLARAARISVARRDLRRHHTMPQCVPPCWQFEIYAVTGVKQVKRALDSRHFSRFDNCCDTNLDDSTTSRYTIFSLTLNSFAAT
jgi:hypothetical protein